MTKNPQLSIVLPCYNESKGLEALVQRFDQVGRGVSFELILVDNGSTDNTAQVLPYLLARYPFARSLRIEVNQGYGHGILTGLRAADGDVLAWSHADLQTDPADIFRAWRVYRSSDRPQRMLVKGCRNGRSLQERVISFGMQAIASVLLRARLHEINAQPKLFHRELLTALQNPPTDLNLDVYVLYAARRCGWRIVEIPVAFPPRQHGQSSWATSWHAKLRTISRSARYLVTLSLQTPPRPPRTVSAPSHRDVAPQRRRAAA
jgi:glycosyltransferase involved in cell wall biosynthesis